MPVERPILGTQAYEQAFPGKWQVWRGVSGTWHVEMGVLDDYKTFDTFAEAINWAQKEARK